MRLHHRLDAGHAGRGLFLVELDAHLLRERRVPGVALRLLPGTARRGDGQLLLRGGRRRRNGRGSERGQRQAPEAFHRTPPLLDSRLLASAPAPRRGGGKARQSAALQDSKTDAPAATSVPAATFTVIVWPLPTSVKQPLMVAEIDAAGHTARAQFSLAVRTSREPYRFRSNRDDDVRALRSSPTAVAVTGNPASSATRTRPLAIASDGTGQQIVLADEAGHERDRAAGCTARQACPAAPPVHHGTPRCGRTSSALRSGRA